MAKLKLKRDLPPKAPKAPPPVPEAPQYKVATLKAVLLNDLVNRIRDGEIVIDNVGNAHRVPAPAAILSVAREFVKQHIADDETIPTAEGLSPSLKRFAEGLIHKRKGPTNAPSHAEGSDEEVEGSNP